MKKHTSHDAMCVTLLVGCSCLVMLTGCKQPVAQADVDSAQVSDSSSPARGTRSSMELPTEPIEYFFFAADGLPTELREELQLAFTQLISRGPAGSTIHLIRTPEHVPIASFVLVDGSYSKRIRNRELQKVLPEINAFFNDSSPVPEDYRCQLGLPRLLDSYWNLRETSLPPRIVLVGDPVYHDPKNAIWSFREGKYPSDVSITSSTSTFPMTRMGHQRLAHDTPIVWITNDSFGVSQLHHDALTRFYWLLFDKSLGGQLAFFGRSVESAMQPTLAVGLAAPNDFFAEGFPQMLAVPRSSERPKPAVEPHASENNDVHAALESARRDPRQTAIAINWTSEDQLTDVDIRLTIKGHKGELYYKNMRTDFGVLLRDIRQPGSLDDLNRERWEVALVEHDKLEDIRCWLNLYEGRAPSAVKVILVHRAKESSQAVTFPPTQGDRAMADLFRRASPAWQGPLDLLANR